MSMGKERTRVGNWPPPPLPQNPPYPCIHPSSPPAPPHTHLHPLYVRALEPQYCGWWWCPRVLVPLTSEGPATPAGPNGELTQA